MKKILIIALPLFIVIIGAFYNYTKNTPERMVKKIIEDLVTDPLIASINTQEYEPNTDLDMLTEHFNQKYSSYFTEEAYNNAITTRLFFTFFKPPRREGEVKINSIELERIKVMPNDISLYGIIQIKIISSTGNSYLQNWNVLSRVIYSDGKWKFRYLTIEPSTN